MTYQLCSVPTCANVLEEYASDGGDFYLTGDARGRCAACNEVVMTEELEPLLEASVEGRVVSKYLLPTETDCHAVHAQLAKGAREARWFSLVETESEYGE